MVLCIEVLPLVSRIFSSRIAPPEGRDPSIFYQHGEGRGGGGGGKSVGWAKAPGTASRVTAGLSRRAHRGADGGHGARGRLPHSRCAGRLCPPYKSTETPM